MSEKNNRVTLKMIAEKANVSPALVSNILNGKGRASKKVHETVRELLEKNGFVPRNRQRPVIFIGDPRSQHDGISAEILVSLLSGISSIFETNRVQLQFELPDNFSQNRLIQLFARNPGGVIVQTGSSLHAQVVQMAKKNKVPVVQAGYDDELADAGATVVDSYNGSYRAVTHLIASGCRRIGLIRWESSGNSRKKFAGYLNALNDAGLPFDERLVAVAPESRRLIPKGELLGRYALKRLYEQCGSDKPDALFIENGFLSPSLIFPTVAPDGSIIPPFTEIPTVHFEDISFASITRVVSGMLGVPDPGKNAMRVHIDWHHVGISAATLMTHMLNNPAMQQPQTMRIEPTLLEF